MYFADNRFGVVLLAVLCLLMLHTAQSAVAEINVRIKPTAIAVNGGTALQVPVTIRCDPSGDLLEALVTATGSTIFGDGFFGSVQCDGTRHSYLVTVRPTEGTFDAGTRVQVSAFVLFCDEIAQDCVSGGDTRRLKIRASKQNP